MKINLTKYKHLIITN